MSNDTFALACIVCVLQPYRPPVDATIMRSMSAPELESYSIGEFVSYKLVKDPQSNTFTITLTGPLDYALLIAHKVANLTVSSEELEELPVPATAIPTPSTG